MTAIMKYGIISPTDSWNIRNWKDQVKIELSFQIITTLQPASVSMSVVKPPVVNTESHRKLLKSTESNRKLPKTNW